MRYFADYLTRQGIAWTHDINADYDALFVNSWTIPYRMVLRAKMAHPSRLVVHRIDGAAQEYGRRDGVDWLQRDVNLLADVTIYQSHYSFTATHERYRLTSMRGPVIHNPVDTAHFSPEGPRYDWPSGVTRVISVGWSPNPLKGNWRIPILARANPEVEFVVVGRHTEVDDLPNVRKIDFLEHKDLPQALRSADAYLSLLQNDACPNVIIEALACGLPVIHVPSGGVPELVRDAGAAFTSDDEFPAALERITDGRDTFATKARHIALDNHQLDAVFARYLDIMRGGERRALPARGLALRATVDFKAYETRQFLRKWRRILTGKQPLRRPRP
jgi:glycosyltransferase involved in cell wall biosynthesis